MKVCFKEFLQGVEFGASLALTGENTQRTGESLFPWSEFASSQFPPFQVLLTSGSPSERESVASD